MAAPKYRVDEPKSLNLWNKMLLKHVVYYFFLILFVCHVISSKEVPRPRGIPLSKKPLYDSSKPFTCLDGSLTIPFSHVNDDYCDCKDGSDEPGTSACSNGVFHCTNAGHKSLNIPSSRVNDGICDCCDGSDEYQSSGMCVNNCQELGKKAREEAERMADIINKGYDIKISLSTQGKKLKEERKQKLTELEREKTQAEAAKSEAEALKAAAEDKENAALSVYKEQEEARQKEEDLKKEAESQEEAHGAFADIDTNGDGLISSDEIKSQWVFDPNKDGTITDDEVKIYMGDNFENGINKENFMESAWMLMRPHYNLKKMIKPPEDTVSEPEELAQELQTEGPEIQQPTDGGDEDDQLTDDLEDDLDDERDDPEPPRFQPNDDLSTTTTEPPTTIYDEETQALINAADAARKEFSEADSRVKDIEREMADTQKLIESDFGPDEEFGPLKGQCFEYEDREYVYRMCMFDKVTQKQSSSSNEVNLGTWGKWDGPEELRYEKMKYENGQGCWNGPARSVAVTVYCGLENQITSVAEPNRCEYVMDFYTPAACREKVSPQQDHLHEEL